MTSQALLFVPSLILPSHCSHLSLQHQLIQKGIGDGQAARWAGSAYKMFWWCRILQTGSAAEQQCWKHEAECLVCFGFFFLVSDKKAKDLELGALWEGEDEYRNRADTANRECGETGSIEKVGYQCLHLEICSMHLSMMAREDRVWGITVSQLVRLHRKM